MSRDSRNTWVDPLEVKVETPTTPATSAAYSKWRYLRAPAIALLVVGVTIGAFFGGAEYQKSTNAHSFNPDTTKKVGTELVAHLNTKKPTPDTSKSVTSVQERTNDRISVNAHKAGTIKYTEIKTYSADDSALATLTIDTAVVSDYGQSGKKVTLYEVTDEKAKLSIAFTWLFDKDGNKAITTFVRKGNKWVQNNQFIVVINDNRAIIRYEQTDVNKHGLQLPEAIEILSSMKLPLKRIVNAKGRRLNIVGDCLGTVLGGIATGILCTGGEVASGGLDTGYCLAAGGETSHTAGDCWDDIF